MQATVALTQEESSPAVGAEAVDSENMAHQEQEQQHIKNLVQIFLLVKPDEWEDRGYGIVGFEWDEVRSLSLLVFLKVLERTPELKHFHPPYTHLRSWKIYTFWSGLESIITRKSRCSTKKALR